jgi:hypothetical protein
MPRWRRGLEIASGADGVIDSTSAFEREWGWKGDDRDPRELSVAWREVIIEEFKQE